MVGETLEREWLHLLETQHTAPRTIQYVGVKRSKGFSSTPAP